MKNFILALFCVLCCAVTVEAACCGGRVRTVRRVSAPVRKVVKQRAYPVRREMCSVIKSCLKVACMLAFGGLTYKTGSLNTYTLRNDNFHCSFYVTDDHNRINERWVGYRSIY